MLSSMCDKMRETADNVERIKNNNADWLWRDGVTLMDAVKELRDAADVIDNLRCSCNDLQFEHEGLKERYSLLLEKTVEMADENERLKVENEQLRKVIDLCSEYIGDGRCEGCVVKQSCDTGGIECWMKAKLICMMHDLGIEVDE